jgi:hypothetical protein
MNSSVCWAITPCSPLKFNRYYGETTRLGLRGGKVSQEKNMHSSLWFILSIILNPEDGGKIFLRNSLKTFLLFWDMKCSTEHHSELIHLIIKFPVVLRYEILSVSLNPILGQFNTRFVGYISKVLYVLFFHRFLVSHRNSSQGVSKPK